MGCGAEVSRGEDQLVEQRAAYGKTIVAQWKFNSPHIKNIRRTARRMLKKADFSPTQPWRLLHPPALSLPRQPLRSGTRLVPSNAQLRG